MFFLGYANCSCFPLYLITVLSRSSYSSPPNPLPRHLCRPPSPPTVPNIPAIRMALQTANPPVIPAAQVANAFISQYYHILHHNPGHVYRFYQDSSVLSRPDSDGVMTTVTTMQGINEKILSYDYKEYKAEIETADAQNSYKDGVTVLVTGCLTSKDNLKRKFAQSFFLAPQENGFFVLNDVFRYVEDGAQLNDHSINGVTDATPVLLNQEPEPNHIPDPPTPDLEPTKVDQEQCVTEKAYDTSDQEMQSVKEKESDIEHPSYSTGNDVAVTAESASSISEEDAPKKSYASIVKVVKGSPGPNKVYVPTNTVKVAPKKTEESLPNVVFGHSKKPGKSFPASATSPSVAEASAPTSTSTLETTEINEEAEGYSIYVSNLPLSVTADQLEVEFKKFGPIKQGGIQVRNKPLQGYCFGFVEFLSSSSMNNAIQASPLNFGGHPAIIEMKRTNAQVGSSGSGSGRYPSGRGLQRDSFRGHGNYGGGRGFVRNEYVNRDEYSGQGRGRAAIGGGDGYQQGRGDGYHQGRGDGYQQGRGDEYQQGRGDEYQQGRGDGYQQGRGDGYQRGRGDGYQRGSGDGYQRGRGDGYQRGRGDSYQRGRGDGYQHVRRESYQQGRGDGYQQGRGRGGRPSGPKQNMVSA